VLNWTRNFFFGRSQWISIICSACLKWRIRRRV